MAPTISIHEIAARDLRIGDRLAFEAVRALDHWYHDTDTPTAGPAIIVTGVAADTVDYAVDVTLSDGDVITTAPDIRVCVTRPWAPTR